MNDNLSTPLRIGMIGTGWMGSAIAPDFKLCEETELVAVAGRNSDRTAAFAARHEVPKAVDAERLITDDDVDLVYIASTHETHFALATAALEAGKAVLVEKAFTVDTLEAARLTDLAERRGLFLMEAMWMYFNPVIARLKVLLADGAIGEPRTLQASFGTAVPMDQDSRLWDPARAGGSLLDQGVYPLALADLIFGEPERVAAIGSYLDFAGVDAGVDTELGMLLGYADGSQALLATSIRSGLPLDASVSGQGGSINIGPAFWCPSELTLIRQGMSPLTERFDIEGNGYVPMLRAVAHAVEAGQREHALSDHAASLRVMRTVDRVRSALRA